MRHITLIGFSRLQVQQQKNPMLFLSRLPMVEPLKYFRAMHWHSKNRMLPASPAVVYAIPLRQGGIPHGTRLHQHLLWDAPYVFLRYSFRIPAKHWIIWFHY